MSSGPRGATTVHCLANSPMRVPSPPRRCARSAETSHCPETQRRGQANAAPAFRVYLLESVYKVVLQKLIPAQIRQLIIYYY